jgi:hypothetical protein
MFNGRIATALIAIAWLSGCSITQLQHDELQGPDALRSGEVYVARQATGFTGGRVGFGRITLFSIPVAPVHIHSDEASDMMDIVRDALETAGYTTKTAGAAHTGPVLAANVDHIRYNNYTWLAPFIPTWGRVNVTLRLESAGAILWQESFAAKGNSFHITDGFNVAATESMTRLADSMVTAFGSEAFQRALVEGG